MKIVGEFDNYLYNILLFIYKKNIQGLYKIKGGVIFLKRLCFFLLNMVYNQIFFWEIRQYMVWRNIGKYLFVLI